MVDPDLQISGGGGGGGGVGAVIQTAWDKEGGGGVQKFFLTFRPLVWSKNKGPSPGSATDKSHLAGSFFDFFYG